MLIGSFKVAFKDAYEALGVVATPDARLALVRRFQAAVVVVTALALLIGLSFLISQRGGAVIRSNVLPAVSVLGVVGLAAKWIWGKVKTLRTSLEANADGLTLFRQLRILWSFRIRQLPQVWRRSALKALVVLSPRDFSQHTVSRQVILICSDGPLTSVRWWRARYVTWHLYRLMSGHYARYPLERYGTLLTELSESRAAFRVLEPPGRRTYQVLFTGRSSKVEPVGDSFEA